MEENTVSNAFNSVNRGSYNFSFFKMNVNVFDELTNPEKLEPLPLSTFFHEYIHFLQDITTTFGLVNSCIVVDKMKFGNHYILNSKDDTFNVPISFVADPKIELNNQLQELYMGFPSPDIYRLEISSIERFESMIYIPDPFNKYAQVIKVNYKVGEKVYTFNLGGLHLSETMCHIAQNIFNPGIIHNDVPYRTAELVAIFIYDVIGNNSLFVFSLCEACLMHFHPGDAFYMMLQLMKEREFVPKNELDIYLFVYENINDADGSDLMFIYERQVVHAIYQLTGYFTTENYDNEKTWIFHVLEEGRKMRKETPFLLLSLLKEPTLYSISLKRIMLNVGTPLMQNLDGDCWFLKPYGLSHLNIQPDRLAALLEIHDSWILGKRECGLKRFCTKNLIGSTTDERCDKAPWSRCNPNEQLCSYAQFLKTWKLMGKEPAF